MKSGFASTLAAAAAALAALPGAVAAPPAASPADPASAPAGRARIVAVGGVHGADRTLTELLQGAGLIDERRNWRGGDARLVMLGDLLGHGEGERATLDMLMRLEAQAAAAGGRVVVLLGQEEVFNLLGHYRRVSPAGFAAFAADEPQGARAAALKRYRVAAQARGRLADRYVAAFERRHPVGFFGRRAAFDVDGVYGRWLLGRPSAVRIDDVCFVHAGLSGAESGAAPDVLSARIGAELRGYLLARKELLARGLLEPETDFYGGFSAADERAAKAGADDPKLAATLAAFRAGAEMLALRPDGPQSDAGPARRLAREALPAVERSLARCGGKRLVVGHAATPGHAVVSRFGGRLLRLDESLLTKVFRGRPALLEIRGDEARAYGLEERKYAPLAVEPDDRPEKGRIDAAADAEAERFLRAAEVVKIEDVGEGVTHPQRVTLREGNVVRRAIFKTINQTLTGNVKAEERELTFTDRYAHEIAAYRIDRAIGMGLVPATVERTIDGKAGSLQLWIERAINEETRLVEKLETDDPERHEAELDAMRVFDALIYNTDRNATNVLYTTDDWEMHLIDHSRAFRLHHSRPVALEGRQLEISPAMRAGMASLERKALLASVGDALSAAQIDAMLARRDLLLAGR
ncbi:MAG: hypothetical protein ABFD84_01730 [Candidatus Polarisedimenticolia bacterium]